MKFDKKEKTDDEGCNNAQSVIVDTDAIGADKLYSAVLAAFLANKRLEQVRTCGCKTEWQDEAYPVLAWYRVVN